MKTFGKDASSASYCLYTEYANFIHQRNIWNLVEAKTLVVSLFVGGGGVIRTFLSSYKLLFLFSSCTVWVPWLSSTSFLKLLATILHIDKNDLSIAVYGISRYGLSHPALVTSMWPHWVVCKYFPFAFWVVVKLVKVQHKPETENAILRAEVVSSS